MRCVKGCLIADRLKVMSGGEQGMIGMIDSRRPVDFYLNAEMTGKLVECFNEHIG